MKQEGQHKKIFNKQKDGVKARKTLKCTSMQATFQSDHQLSSVATTLTQTILLMTAELKLLSVTKMFEQSKRHSWDMESRSLLTAKTFCANISTTANLHAADFCWKSSDSISAASRE